MQEYQNLNALEPLGLCATGFSPFSNPICHRIIVVFSRITAATQGYHMLFLCSVAKKLRKLMWHNDPNLYIHHNWDGQADPPAPGAASSNEPLARIISTVLA